MKHLLFVIIAMLFCMGFVSCRTSKPQINRSTKTFDSIITVYDKTKVDSLEKVLEILQKENYQLRKTNISNEKTETTEKITTEKYDTLGNVTEKVVNERFTTTIKNLENKLEMTQLILNYQKQTIDSISKLNEKLKQEVLLKTKIDDKSIVIKKVVPSWCWWLLGINALIICIIGIKFYVRWKTKI